MNIPLTNVGVVVGRLMGMHLGHMTIIDKMIDTHGYDSCVVFLGSTNAPLTFKNIFSYSDRKLMLKKLYPNIRVVGIPDFNDDYAWCEHLSDMISSIFYNKDVHVTFYTGSDGDISYLDRSLFNSLDIFCIDRNDNELLSGTNIRNRLSNNDSIDGLVDARIIEDMTNIFRLRINSIF